MSDDDKDKESKIIKGPWLDNNDISEEVLKEVEKIIEQEKLEKQAKQKPIEEKITIALIELRIICLTLSVSTIFAFSIDSCIIKLATLI